MVLTWLRIGVWKGEPVKPKPLEGSLEGEEARQLLDLLTGMVRWVPEERKSARELLGHPWLVSGSDSEGAAAAEMVRDDDFD